jgi:hypothetical protein
LNQVKDQKKETISKKLELDSALGEKMGVLNEKKRDIN